MPSIFCIAFYLRSIYHVSEALLAFGTVLSHFSAETFSSCRYLAETCTKNKAGSTYQSVI